MQQLHAQLAAYERLCRTLDSELGCSTNPHTETEFTPMATLSEGPAEEEEGEEEEEKEGEEEEEGRVSRLEESENENGGMVTTKFEASASRTTLSPLPIPTFVVSSYDEEVDLVPSPPTTPSGKAHVTLPVTGVAPNTLFSELAHPSTSTYPPPTLTADASTNTSFVATADEVTNTSLVTASIAEAVTNTLLAATDDAVTNTLLMATTDAVTNTSLTATADSVTNTSFTTNADAATNTLLTATNDAVTNTSLVATTDVFTNTALPATANVFTNTSFIQDSPEKPPEEIGSPTNARATDAAALLQVSLDEARAREVSQEALVLSLREQLREGETERTTAAAKMAEMEERLKVGEGGVVYLLVT